MNRTSSYPFNATTPLPPIPGQGAERLYTVKEVGEYLHVEPRTVGKLISGEDRPNKLRASFIGRRWLVTESALREFVEASQ